MKFRDVWISAFAMASCSCQHVWVDTENPFVGRCYFQQATTLQRLTPNQIRPKEAELFLEKGFDFRKARANGLDGKPTTEIRELKNGCAFKLNRLIASEGGVGTTVSYEMLALSKDCEVDHYYITGFYDDCVAADMHNPSCELNKPSLKQIDCPR